MGRHGSGGGDRPHLGLWLWVNPMERPLMQQLRTSLELKASCSGHDGTIASLPSLPITSRRASPLLLMTPFPWSLYPGFSQEPPSLPTSLVERFNSVCLSKASFLEEETCCPRHASPYAPWGDSEFGGGRLTWGRLSTYTKPSTCGSRQSAHVRGRGSSKVQQVVG